MATASMLGAEQAGNLDKKTPERFVRMLLGKFGFRQNTALKWTEIAAAVEEAAIYARVPGVAFELGHFEPPEAKVRKERKKKEAPSADPLQVADAVQVDQLQEQAADKAQVVRMRALQRAVEEHAEAAGVAGGAARVNVFRLVLHPTSFSQTVENFFDLAFLVKDGWVRLLAEEDGLYSQPSKPPTTDQFVSGELRTGGRGIQNILRLDMPTWRALVKRWAPGGQLPLLPARGAEDEGGSRKKQRAA